MRVGQLRRWCISGSTDPSSVFAVTVGTLAVLSSASEDPFGKDKRGKLAEARSLVATFWLSNVVSPWFCARLAIKAAWNSIGNKNNGAPNCDMAGALPLSESLSLPVSS
jgi:hypothetical protein